VSLAAWDHTGPGEIRPTAMLRAAAAVAAVGMLVIYSQAWVFPLIGEGSGVEAAGGLVRALFLPAYAVGAVLLACSPGAALRALARQPFLIALMIIVALSILWSVAPDQSARRVFAVYCTTLGGTILAVRYRWAQLAEILAASFAVIAVLSLLAVLLAPSIGVMSALFPGAWRGLWAEKNAFGGNMALGFVIMVAAAVLNPSRARLWAGFAALTLFLVLMSTSKTALVSLLLGGGAAIFVAFARRGPAAGVASVWLAAVGAGVIAVVALFGMDAVFALLGKDATFTGRTQIWSAAMRQIAERPWTGYGYDVVWTQKGVWGPLPWIIKDAGFKPSHAHNSWIEQWLGLGLFGLAAFALFFFQTIALAAVAIFRHRGAFLAVPYLAVYGLMTLTESVAVVYNDLRWVIFCAIAVKLAWPDREDAA
jgi:O-antigen ligase